MIFRALEAAEGAVWAMEEGALARLLIIAAREHEVSIEALEAYRAASLDKGEQAEVRNGVAIITATGDLFKRANMFTAMSGATSYEIMRRDLQAAVDDPKVKAILLNLDTPGGEASGAGELAAAVHSVRGVKPIKAYVNGMAASAGYWIAAAADEIIVDAQAILGSIGVQMAMRTRADAAGTTTHKFISSQSPMKNADPGSEAGAAHIQSVVDAMASVFVEAVATYRGVGVAKVLSDFGKGGILVGQDAVKAGLADRLGNFEGVLAELSAGRSSSPISSDGKTKTMTEAPVASTFVNQVVATALADANAARSAPAKTEARAEPVVSAEEARAAEEDALVARITGDDSIVVQGAERRARERQRAEAGQATAAVRAQEALDAEALVARIIAA